MIDPAFMEARPPARMAAAGITGGAVYDALVGATAAHHRAVLMTLDARAMETYRRIGVDVELLG